MKLSRKILSNSLPAMVILECVSPSCNGQKIGEYDYTSSKPQERKLSQLPPPPLWSGEITAGICGGICNGQFEVTILSLSKDSFEFDEEFVPNLLIRARNPMKIPVVLSTGETKPADPAQIINGTP